MNEPSRVLAWLFHKVCFEENGDGPNQPAAQNADSHGGPADLASSRRFFARFRGHLDVRGKSVLDVGCGGGPTCVEAVLRGASYAVGVDIRQSVIDEAREAVRQTHPQLASKITFLRTDGSLRELDGERFDVVVSKDSFEHYAHPARSLEAMSSVVQPGGIIAIGFAPLWKSPRGGHISYMTGLPWAHLLFPEHVIMAERRRFRPQEGARCFEEVSGGLNKMTLGRFQAIVGASGLQIVYLATNVSDHPAVRLMTAVSHVPLLREYMTTSAYAILRSTV